MPKLDPTERLKQFVNRLKQLESKDGRMTRAQHSARNGSNAGVGAWHYDPGQTWLVRRWQAASLLGLYPIGDRPSSAYSATYWIEDGTALVECGAQDWDIVLIWQAGGDFYTRLLTGEEGQEVSELYRTMTMIAFGFHPKRRPSDRAPRKRKKP